ncbi:acyl-CoA dehydrogenase [Stigmatella aurantiaca]|uniref:3-methylmercaptopropionyl-CoA dehydrogenase n=1 Tax=Stigmatella aurantiaca (strain DW4/3-1) TaxID=378806 RepID=Q094T8_STIAD|nr:acyl-CoA dehydrogenase [Stigmatella aurantiaca]ADO73233.1 Acyl-CoA dehydrogenase [Stigmatella aurantiaca DW4/3-1]EAU67228.1 acyl-CoA dehydrogenase [Stigmatella aurantiaca DW4/3-1]
MSAGINHYKTDLREIFFTLFEQFGLSQVVGQAPFDAWGPEEAKAVLHETYRFSKDVLGPLNASGDREGCRVENGTVIAPSGFKDAWKKLYEQGFKTVGVSQEHGGQGAPMMLQMAVEEMLCGANAAFNMYPGLAYGAAELIAECGTPEQKHHYVERMLNGTWGGTMCLTEPQAGSDVGAAKTTARRNADGTYNIRGTKIFISAGDHDLAENIIHLVLARVEGAAVGTKGLSLFIVPKLRINKDGSAGPSNDVALGSIEHKMGINGSSTCVLNFGENDACVGELVGGVEHVGMSQMFKMMNGARIAVGIQGVALASAAYFNALDYAKERKQGGSFTKWKDPASPRVPIIEHPDVRRMLLEIKSHVEGIRALIFKLAMHTDKAKQLAGKDDDKAAYHRGQVEVLTPLVKAYGSDQAFRLCAQAIQIYGGAGFCQDYPVEQYCRDSKIFSIYEGTNHIQAMDLVGRKLGQAGGANFQQFMEDVGGFIEANRDHKTFGTEVKVLAAAQEGLMASAMAVLGWSQDPAKTQLIPLSANRFLQMMSEVAVGWLLLDAAVLAEKSMAGLSDNHPDKAFYEGKKWSALWYARNVLPNVEQAARLMALEDASPMDISDAAFSAV